MKTTLNLAALLFINFIYSQNFGLDTSFETDGKLYNTTISQFPQAVFFEENKYFFVFDTSFYSINYDGTPNTLFGTNGFLFFNNSTESFVTKGAKMYNGYIYIFGQHSYNSSFSNKNLFIAKLSTTGVFDISFGTNGFVKLDTGVESEIINDLIFNSDNKIMAIGTRTNTVFVSKFNENGLLDISFNLIGYKSFPLTSGDGALGISIHSYLGDYLLVGSNLPSVFTGVKQLLIMKINQEGNLIENYGINGLSTINLAGQGSTGSYTMLKSKLFENRLYIVYYFGWSFSTQMNQLVKYNLTTNVKTDICYMPFVKYDYLFDNDENIYITGTDRCSPPTSSFCQRNFIIYKRNNSGILDLTFNGTGSYSYNFFPSDLYSDDMSSVLYRHSDGKILIVGQIYNPYSPPGVGTSGFTAIRIVDTPLSTEEINIDKLSVFPNPVKEQINLNIPDNQTLMEIEILDTNGRLILNQKKNFNQIYIGSLTQGIYFLKVKTDQNISIVKFLKE